MAGSIDHFNEELFGHYARIGKAIACGKRLEILDVLTQGPRSVEVLATRTGATVANTSRHLQILRGAKLVAGKRNGRVITYRIAGHGVETFLRQLRQFAELHLLEIGQTKQDFIESRIGFDPVDRNELLRRVRDGEAIAIDVRPSEEFAEGHLGGAISVPLDDLKKLLKSIPMDRDVVAYCRGPHCVLSVEAVEFLRKRGYRAHRIDMGPREWRELGFPIQTAAGTDS